MLVWAQIAKTDPRGNLRELVTNNVDAVTRRAKVMSCKMEREKVSRLESTIAFVSLFCR